MTEKLETFLSAIAAAAQGQTEALEADIQSREALLRAGAEKTAAAEAKYHEEAMLSRAESQTALQVSARQAGQKTALLERRQSYAEQVFEQVRAKIRAYAASEEYPERLKALLRQGMEALGKGQTVIWLRREDLHYGELLQAECPGAQVCEGDFALGGLQLSVDARRADLSFDTALEEQKSRFAELSGMEIEA